MGEDNRDSGKKQKEDSAINTQRVNLRKYKQGGNETAETNTDNDTKDVKLNTRTQETNTYTQ